MKGRDPGFARTNSFYLTIRGVFPYIPATKRNYKESIMSLNKKYTWADFLKEHPEHKEKKLKRTSKEGQKAFEAAYKQHSKDYLKDRLVKIDNEKKRATDKRTALSKDLKAIKTNIKVKGKNIKGKIETVSAYLTELDKLQERTKDTSKHL